MIIISPLSNTSSPPIALRRVDLPLPLLPSRKTRPFSGNVIETSFNAITLSDFFDFEILYVFTKNYSDYTQIASRFTNLRGYLSTI